MSFPLGTYGVDPSARTVWAVVNYVADYAAAELKNRARNKGYDRWGP